jgi:hypothetical protein
MFPCLYSCPCSHRPFAPLPYKYLLIRPYPLLLKVLHICLPSAIRPKVILLPLWLYAVLLLPLFTCLQIDLCTQTCQSYSHIQAFSVSCNTTRNFSPPKSSHNWYLFFTQNLAPLLPPKNGQLLPKGTLSPSYSLVLPAVLTQGFSSEPQHTENDLHNYFSQFLKRWYKRTIILAVQEKLIHY